MWNRPLEKAVCPGVCAQQTEHVKLKIQFSCIIYSCLRDVFGIFVFDRYEYLRREGNFERSAGLQIGVDTIEVRENSV